MLKQLNKTDKSISLIRCISMIMIVSCHILQFYGNALAYWLNVGVQIFLIISGYLYSGKEINNSVKWIIKNIMKILVDYYIYILTISLVLSVIQSDIMSVTVLIKMIIFLSYPKGLNHFWFIKYILFCYFITPFIHQLWNRLIKYGSICYLIFIIILIIINFTVINFSLFSIAVVDSYLLGFLWGKIKNGNLNIKVKMGFVIFICTIAALMNIVRLMGELNVISFFSKFELYIDFSRAFLGFALFILMYRLFSVISLTKIEQILIISDKYSYDIYITHHFYILGCYSFMTLTKYTVLNILLIIAATFISALILEKLSFIIKQHIKLKILNRTKLK